MPLIKNRLRRTAPRQALKFQLTRQHRVINEFARRIVSNQYGVDLLIGNAVISSEGYLTHVGTDAGDHYRSTRYFGPTYGVRSLLGKIAPRFIDIFLAIHIRWRHKRNSASKISSV